MQYCVVRVLNSTNSNNNGGSSRWFCFHQSSEVLIGPPGLDGGPAAVDPSICEL